MDMNQNNRPRGESSSTQRRRRPTSAENPGAQRAPRRRTARRRKPDREIVITPGKPFEKKKLLMQIAVVATVVLAVVFTLSLFFKVNKIAVSGNDRYSPKVVAKASGITKGDGLLGLNDARIAGRIITELPYVKTVRIGIKLPGMVNIEIEELDVVYAIADEDDQWWLLTSEGRIVERIDEFSASGYTKILGVVITEAKTGKDAVAKESVPDATTESGETVPVTISGSDRLYTALAILKHLEKNDVIGEMTQVDVTNMASIKMQYGQRFAVMLGDSADLPEKIELAVSCIRDLRDYDKGILDVSYTDLPQPIYTPDSR